MEIMRQALEQARRAGWSSSTRWPTTLAAPRANISAFAPRIVTIRIPVEKIRDVIGPGGKTIRGIIEKTGVKIDVEDDGRVNVASADEASAAKAIAMIQELTATPELNKTYLGRVERITDFGAFIEIMPGRRRPAARLGDRRLPRQGRARRAQGRRADHGQGDQRRPVRQGSAQPEGAARARRRTAARPAAGGGEPRRRMRRRGHVTDRAASGAKAHRFRHAEVSPGDVGVSVVDTEASPMTRRSIASLGRTAAGSRSRSCRDRAAQSRPHAGRSSAGTSRSRPAPVAYESRPTIEVA